MIKVQGNFSSGGTASAGFRPNGTHTVLFNGTSAQTVSLAYGSDGRHYFQNANAEWGQDYTPDVYQMSLDGRTVYVVDASNDGGAYVGLFAKDGEKIAEAFAGESDGLEWFDAPSSGA